MKYHRADRAIPVGVMVKHVPDSAPAAGVRPSEIDWYDRGTRCAFHDGKVDGPFWRTSERLKWQAEKIQIALYPRNG